MFLTDGPDAAEQIYVFAHGAGGAMDTPFMTTVARELGERGIRVVRFEFPYMAARRTGGKRGAPDREAVLLSTWREVAAQLGGGPRLFIGGKSMGGRMATLVAEELKVRGAVVFGYPFHPPGQPAKLRTAHLETLTTPMLVLQASAICSERATTWPATSSLRKSVSSGFRTAITRSSRARKRGRPSARTFATPSTPPRRSWAAHERHARKGLGRRG